jgi:AraC-like DNA-binding protein
MLVGRATFRRLCAARDLLAEVTDDAPTVAAIARELRLSPHHFIRQFHAVFGATPHQWRIDARIERAKRLLALDAHSVTGVCLEVGFESLGSFSALFARRVGASPSDYRRRVRALVQVPGALPHELAPGCLSLMARLPPGAFAQFSRSAPRRT